MIDRVSDPHDSEPKRIVALGKSVDWYPRDPQTCQLRKIDMSHQSAAAQKNSHEQRNQREPEVDLRYWEGVGRVLLKKKEQKTCCMYS